MPADPEPPRDREAKAGLYALSGMGLEFGAAVGLGVALGWWIDTKLDSSPWGILIGVALGFTAGLMRIVRETRNRFGR